MKKVNVLATVAFVAVSFVSSVLFSSCSMQKNEDEIQTIEVPGPTIEKTKTIKQIINNVFTAQTNKDNLEYRYNGSLARRSWVTPAQKILYQSSENQIEPTLEFKGDNQWMWMDSNGMLFTATEENFQLDSCTLTASVTAKKEMALFRIHPQVAEVIANFSDEGMVTDQRTGQSATFSMPIPNVSYFVADSTVQVRWKTETVIEIQHDTTYIVRDSIRTETITEYVTVFKDRNLAIINGFGYGEIRYFKDGKTFVFRMDLDQINILREESGWGIAALVSENLQGFTLDDEQVAKYTVEANGINLEKVSFVGKNASFMKINDIFKYGTATVNVSVSYNEDGENVNEDFQVSASYFHELKVEKKTDDVTPVVTGYTYTVDKSTKIVDHTADGSTYGEKMTVKVTRNEDGKVWKYQFMMWETGCLLPTVTGTQVADTVILRRDYRPEDYSKDGWAGTFPNEKEGFTRVATAKAYLYDTYFKAVAGFSKNEHAAHSQIVFGSSTVTFTDAETGYTEVIYTAGTTDIKVTADKVIFDANTEAEVNGRGMEYHYIGSHVLSVSQTLNGEEVYTQTRAEALLAPNN